MRRQQGIAVWLSVALAVMSFTAPAIRAADSASAPHYIIDAKIDPAPKTLEAEVVLRLPEKFAGKRVEFLLSQSLEVVSSAPAARRLELGSAAGFVGINGSPPRASDAARASRYAVQLPAGRRELRVRYRGRVDFGFETPTQEYARGFAETAGVIRPEGVYLAGRSLWYPYLGEALVTVELTTQAPAGWQLVSAGSGQAGGTDGKARWVSKQPLDELHIVGGPLTRYARGAGPATAEVYLRKPDDALAARYLEATARNLAMYRELLGPYPYDKFALVENFWETGYGMPSFTLLGPEVIRFPFILTSSFPHEVLHNWFGTGVFVDYPSGNWSEGLTAYLADHLYKEQVGQGAEYRRDTLKRYRDYVRANRDFPLTQFVSRESPTTEAVGYGKSLMAFHMLRRKVGDAAFTQALRKFYRAQLGRRASFTDLGAAFGEPEFIRHWTTRVGAPELGVENLRVTPVEGGVRISGDLLQSQPGAAFRLEVPMVLRGREGLRTHSVVSNEKRVSFAFTQNGLPLSLDVDPEFDLFRLLDPRETAPSLGQIFGDGQVLAIVPALASTAELAAYEAMIEFWRGKDAQKISVIRDSDFVSLPRDRSVWIIGKGNTLATRLFPDNAAQGFLRGKDGMQLGASAVNYRDHAIVAVQRHPLNTSKVVGLLVLDRLDAAAGLARKLPHYGKYSYLAFEGAEPANDVKGEWVAADSPLHFDLRLPEEQAEALPPVKLPARAALAELPAVFDASALAAHVRWLADPAREGRGVGSAGIDAAASYIADAFKTAGLAPGGATMQAARVGVRPGVGAPNYFQNFEFTPPGAQQPVIARNVIAVLPGTDAALAGQAVILAAHYDHLGLGGNGAHAEDAGKLHPGADDNASGVAVLIEVARAMANAGPYGRTVLFIAFSGEESGLAGSKYFVANPLGYTDIRAVLNLDAVGRLSTGPLSALGTGNATEWPHIFRGIGFTTGVSVKSVDGAAQASDQQSFIDRGVPAVQLFTGAHLDYHRPTDTAEKVDKEGLGKVAVVAREAMGYLAARPEPLTVTIAGQKGGAQPATGTRRVAFGFVPDFAHQGAGVRADSIVPGSPAAKAGFRAGDLLLSIDGKTIDSLQTFSRLLAAYQPGAKVQARYRRDTAEAAVTVELSAR
jgi:aminopeptidase N